MQSLKEDGSITLIEVAQIVNELIRESQRQVGDIVMYGSSTMPLNYLACDGAAVSRTDYKLLYSIIGTTFGTGDGSTTFNLPDFRGIFPKGAGTTTRVAGVDATGAAYAGTLGTYLQDKEQGHYHSLNSVGGYTSNNILYTVAGAGALPGVVRSSVGGSQANITIVAPYTDGTNGTPRTGATTEPQSLGITFIIKAR